MTCPEQGRRIEKIDLGQCSERIWMDAWHKGRCSKKAVVVRDGKSFCAIHDPEYIKRKNAESHAKYEANKCRRCGIHFSTRYEREHYKYCPICGTKREA